MLEYIVNHKTQDLAAKLETSPERQPDLADIWIRFQRNRAKKEVQHDILEHDILVPTSRPKEENTGNESPEEFGKKGISFRRRSE